MKIFFVGNNKVDFNIVQKHKQSSLISYFYLKSKNVQKINDNLFTKSKKERSKIIWVQ